MWVLLAAVLAAGADGGASDARISVDVEWEGPDSCPPRARFEAELRARSSRLQVVEPATGAEAHVAVKVIEKNKKFSAVSKLRTSLSGVTTREFKSTQCETLVQAAALATSMLLDPEGTKLGKVSIAPPPPPVEEVPDAGAPLPPPETDAGLEVVAVVEPPPVVIDAGVAIVEERAVDAGVAPPSPLQVELGAAGGITTAISGLVDPLFRLQLALGFGRLRVELAPTLVMGRRVSNPSVGVAQYFGAGGRVAVCVGMPLGSLLRLEFGIDLDVLAVPVSAPDAEVPGAKVGLLLAPGALGRLVFSFGQLRLSLEASSGLNTRAEAYVITGSGVVFSAPRFFGGGVVAVGWAL
ncbi:MAG: hypothetical protein U0228_25345 [Myxococcaceae bacterium]